MRRARVLCLVGLVMSGSALTLACGGTGGGGDLFEALGIVDAGGVDSTTPGSGNDSGPSQSGGSVDAGRDAAKDGGGDATASAGDGGDGGGDAASDSGTGNADSGSGGGDDSGSDAGAGGTDDGGSGSSDGGSGTTDSGSGGDGGHEEPDGGKDAGGTRDGGDDGGKRACHDVPQLGEEVARVYQVGGGDYPLTGPGGLLPEGTFVRTEDVVHVPFLSSSAPSASYFETLRITKSKKDVSPPEYIAESTLRDAALLGPPVSPDGGIDLNTRESFSLVSQISIPAGAAHEWTATCPTAGTGEPVRYLLKGNNGGFALYFTTEPWVASTDPVGTVRVITYEPVSK